MSRNVIDSSALEEVQNEINKAIRENDAQKTHFWNSFLNLVETSQMIKFMKSRNTQPELMNLIRYLGKKEENLLEVIAEYDLLFE